MPCYFPSYESEGAGIDTSLANLSRILPSGGFYEVDYTAGENSIAIF